MQAILLKWIMRLRWLFEPTHPNVIRFPAAPGLIYYKPSDGALIYDHKRLQSRGRKIPH